MRRGTAAVAEFTGQTAAATRGARELERAASAAASATARVRGPGGRFTKGGGAGAAPGGGAAAAAKAVTALTAGLPPGVTRDAAGRLRHANGRFVSDGEKRALGLASTSTSAATAARFAAGGGGSRLRPPSGGGGGGGGRAKFEPPPERASTGFGAIASGAAGVAKMAAAAALAAGAFAVATGVMAVKTSEARQNLFTSFEVMLKSKDKATELVSGIEKFANTTPYTTGQVGDAMKSLVGAGYSAKEAFDIFKRVGDVGAFSNFDENALKGVTRAIVQIKAKGKLSAEELNQIFEAAPGAVSRETLVDKLAKNLGKSRAVITKELETGKIKAEAGIKAILDTIDQTISGGVAGGLMDKLGSSITGRLSTLMDIPGTLLGKTSDMPGFEALRGALGNLIDGFEAAKGPLSAAVQGITNDVFGALFGGLGGAGGKDTFTNIFLGIAAAIEWVRETVKTLKPYVMEALTIFGAFWDGFKQAWIAVTPALAAIWEGLKAAFGGENQTMLEVISTLARKVGVALGWLSVVVVTLGSIFLAVGQVFTAFVTAVVSGFVWVMTLVTGTVVDALGSLPARAIQWGVEIVKGLANGILSSLGLASSASGQLAAAATDGAVTELKVQSPSKVFEGIGGNVAAGMAVGIGAGTGDVQAAMGAMVAAPGAGAGPPVGLLGSPGSRGGGGLAGGAVTFVYNINAAGLEGRAAGEAFADKMRPLFEGEMRAWAEQALAELGEAGFGAAGA